MAPLSWGRSPEWREVSHPGAQGLNYIRAGGPEIRQGPDKGQTDFQTGCQKQKKGGKGAVQKKKGKKKVCSLRGTHQTPNLGRVNPVGQKASERIGGITPINHLLSERRGHTHGRGGVAERTKGWRAWGVTASHRLKATGQRLRKVEGREEVRGDPIAEAECS